MGDSLQLQVNLQDRQGNAIKPEGLSIRYTSSRPEDIRVDSQGQVTALKDFGYTNIRAEIAGKSAELLISVNNVSIGGSSASGSTQAQIRSNSSEVKVGGIITFSGNKLSDFSRITIDGVDAPIVSQSPGQLQVRVPATARRGNVQAYSSTGSQTLKIRLANRVWFVNAAATGQNNGESWTNAFSDLQSALAVAQQGDEVWIAEGKYVPSQTGDRTVFFNVPEEVTLYGGFTGGESFVDERDTANHKALLSGDLNNDDVYGALPFTNASDNSLNILRHGNNVVLDGVIIEGGYANNVSDLSSPRGAGIYSSGNNLTLRNAELRNLFSGDRSGGWENNGGSATVENVTFFRITGSGSVAGAIYNESGNMQFKNVTFDTCTNNAGGGGGVYNESGDLSFENATFQNNQANGSGGAGVYNGSGNLRFDTVSFVNNQANGGGGGGVYNSSGNLTFNNATFDNNTANGGGGAGIRTSGGTLTLEEGSFSNGEARGAGGSGIYASGVTLNLSDVSFSDNDHSLGALNISGGSLVGDRLTFTDNSATAPGGGIYSSGALTLSNSSFDNNDTTSIGGGISHSSNANVSITNTSFQNCDATSPGGGIYLDSSNANVTLENLIFTQNISTNGNGGGLYIGLADMLTITNSVFAQNTSQNPGGGAYINANSSTLSRLTFNNNSSQSTGGGMQLDGTTANLDHLIFTNNSSQAPGGGLYLGVSNPVTLSNAAFANNIANNFGGGLYASGGPVTLTHASFSENSATDGDAIYNGTSSLTLRNSIIWDNEATPITMQSGTLTSLYSILKDLGTYTLESGSTGNSSADPNFFNLIDLDGPDNILGTQDDGVSLGLNSPAVNLDTSGTPPSSTDITGRSRDNQPDAGAYERLP